MELALEVLQQTFLETLYTLHLLSAKILVILTLETWILLGQVMGTKISTLHKLILSGWWTVDKVLRVSLMVTCISEKHDMSSIDELS